MPCARALQGEMTLFVFTRKYEQKKWFRDEIVLDENCFVDNIFK